MKTPKLGTGERFSKLVDDLMEKQNMTKEGAQRLAAFIGRKKYGNAKFQQLAQGKGGGNLKDILSKY